jgi:tripartite-type tricarboxylate transporter receptor subunit TctC
MKIATMLVAAALAAPVADAQEFPARAIHIVVPNPAGGTVDLVARAVANGLGASVHQPVVVELKPGGNNIIGTEAVARAAPDGYTLLMAGTHLTINPLLRKLPYDGLNAFVPVALLAATPNVIAVTASLPVRNVAELVALAKARPRELNCATMPPGNGIQLAAERFRARAGIDLNVIPYQGGVQAALAVAAGHAEVLVAPLSDAMPHVLSGRLRILAVTSPRRMEVVPDVPTLAESGYAGFQSLQWFGAVAPAGTPPAIVNRLSEEMRRAVERPEVRASFAKVGLAVMPMASDEFDAFMRDEMKGFAQVIRDNNIKVD